MHSSFSWSWIETEAARVADTWRVCAQRPLPSAPQFTAREQRKREKVYDCAMSAAERELDAIPHSRADRLALQNRLAAVFPPFAAAALGLEGEAIRFIADGFLPAGVEFARAARRFDPALAMAEIVQACRNAWTVCGLQPLLKARLHVTPSIVGYSLLYPYTDNYLDRSDESSESKRQFCRRFRRRLHGERLPALNDHEAAIWALVGMIEGEYPRASYAQVFDSLLAIHRAQEESIAQLGGRACRESEILRISFAKGGSSVLADACLVRGWLSPSESQISFDWGALLQLGDDLQDVREDLRRGSATLFTRVVAEGKTLDALVTQLLNFSHHVGGELDGFANGSKALKNLLRMSWRSIIVGAVANAQEFFSAAFLAEIERTSPFRFTILRRRREHLTGCQGLYARAFNVFVDDPREDNSLTAAPQIGPSMMHNSVPLAASQP